MFYIKDSCTNYKEKYSNKKIPEFALSNTKHCVKTTISKVCFVKNLCAKIIRQRIYPTVAHQLAKLPQPLCIKFYEGAIRDVEHFNSSEITPSLT